MAKSKKPAKAAAPAPSAVKILKKSAGPRAGNDFWAAAAKAVDGADYRTDAMKAKAVEAFAAHLETKARPPLATAADYHSSPEYKKARRSLAGWLAAGTALAMISGKEDLIQYAFITTDMWNERFDEFWEVRHPVKGKAPEADPAAEDADEAGEDAKADDSAGDGEDAPAPTVTDDSEAGAAA